MDLNEKMLSVAGFKQEKEPNTYASGNPYLVRGWLCPDGKFYGNHPPHFPTDMNACEKWIIPELQRRGYGFVLFVLCDTQGKAPFRAELYNYDIEGEHLAHLGTSENLLATAFCEAVSKMEVNGVKR